MREIGGKTGTQKCGRAGVLYLTFVGIKMFWNAPQGIPKSEPKEALPKRGSAWYVGVLTDLSNLKAVAFFRSLFAVFLPAHTPLWLQFTSAGVVVMIDVCWLATVACVFSLGPIARGDTRIKKWIEYVTGGILDSV
ncbi:hypothetical protein KSC_070370 [Ktedonobacter sp. SOSP1-52]|uniref:LysE family translocator n=1 Tax=Ktedonobacter sp. SOSP1-52 TaxID=2778366 RepID=UPI0019157E84|nr:LysE family transporter [Ktedonobacter sp. SOSP1-52]GHO68145.1 hypothetical protein KSC_070370 [Ktedonobacter sp. SOSP1-52]